MNKNTLFQASFIIILSLLVGIFYNLSHPNKIPFIAEEKNVDYLQSDSLLLALKKQDSIQRTADSIKLLSFKRDDSLKLAAEKRIKDSLESVLRLDSLKRINDSLRAVKKRIDDSLKALENKTKDSFVKPVDIKLDFAKALFDKKYLFIDSRDEADYNVGHIPGAVNIPYKKLDQYKSRFNDFSKEEVIVIYCSASCDVSIDMAYAMAKEGFKKLYIFHGGWDEWIAAGYPSSNSN
ncbi:MAG: rhodanese-like domain-containing protein [Ignavibacteria bacterium]